MRTNFRLSVGNRRDTRADCPYDSANADGERTVVPETQYCLMLTDHIRVTFGSSDSEPMLCSLLRSMDAVRMVVVAGL